MDQLHARIVPHHVIIALDLLHHAIMAAVLTDLAITVQDHVLIAVRHHVLTEEDQEDISLLKNNKCGQQVSADRIVIESPMSKKPSQSIAFLQL